MMKKKEKNQFQNFIQLRGIEAKKEIENFLNNEKNDVIDNLISDFFIKIYFSKSIMREKSNDRELQYSKNLKNNLNVLSNGISIQHLNESTKIQTWDRKISDCYICYWDRHPFNWNPVKLHFSKIGRHPLSIIQNKSNQEFISCYEFCSYECQYAYILNLLDSKKSNPIIENAYYYMQYEFNQSYPDEKLNPANDPILIIGNSSQGIITIEDFRKNLKKYINLNNIIRSKSYPIFQISEFNS